MAPRTVFISGGTGAIGSGLVGAFADAGYKVVFTYHQRRDQAMALAARYEATPFRVDLLDPEVRLPIDAADILVNNAGVNLSGHGIGDTSDRELRTTFEVNVVGVLRYARHFSTHMKQANYGRIININSLYGIVAPPLRLSYAASKFALRAVTESLARELASSGITVNDICPGPVDSAILRAMGEGRVEEGLYATVEDYLQVCASEVPIGRLLHPTDVAEAALFLASEGAAAITGTMLRVDGGLRG